MVSSIIVPAICIAALFAIPVFLAKHSRQVQKNGSWHTHGARMRRWANGRWYYREMTGDEYDQERSDRVW